MPRPTPTLVVLLTLLSNLTHAAIDRRAIVQRYNPVRTSSGASNATTPMQVGNGNFAFGADVTGLQTLYPFSIMSSWGWKNDSLPPNRTWADVDDYRGASWDFHGRPVRYDFGGDPLIEQWLISNPNRVNLGSVGFVFFDRDGRKVENTTASDITDVTQTLDLWTGVISSRFTYDGEQVTVTTTCAQDVDVVGVSVESSLIAQRRLGVFLDFPWNDGSNKFSAPFVGFFNETDKHSTVLENNNLGEGVRARVAHTMVNSTFFTSVGGDAFTISRDTPSVHRYTLLPSRPETSQFSFTLGYADSAHQSLPTVPEIKSSSSSAWSSYWSTAGFVDLVTGSSDPRSVEIQRRIILSRYLMRVNEAGKNPPQEYGKFHMEQYFWHSAHWALWDNWDLLRRSLPTYSDFLTTSLLRAQVQQGFAAGARWPKMTDPSGRSSPGDINNLLIWEQPHPLVFATYERRAFPNDRSVLERWSPVVRATADFMSSFAWWNASTNVYDIGPPMYPVAEDTNPNVTLNPAFELSYWRLGLTLASDWLDALDEPVPANWSDVLEHLAPLPTQDGLYAIYEGAPEGFWEMPEFTSDHPALAGLVGWLPPTLGVDVDVANETTHRVWTAWNATNLWGWDFPMLAMSAARLGDQAQAVDFLLHPDFQFDDVGMPIGGVRVPTPYFPGAGALLYAVAFMAEGWDGSVGGAPGFPDGWNVTVEGLHRAL